MCILRPTIRLIAPASSLPRTDALSHTIHIAAFSRGIRDRHSTLLDTWDSLIMPWMPRQWRSELCTVPRRSFARRSEAKPIPENYKILGVHFDASPKEIKIGFLEQVKLNHPDVSSEPDAAEKFDK